MGVGVEDAHVVYANTHFNRPVTAGNHSYCNGERRGKG